MPDTGNTAGRVYLIVGNTGAGKSTYASMLSRRLRAHIFANDPWMKTLFFPDMPPDPDYHWTLERTQRIERQICAEAAKLSALGMDVILDLGFFERSQRDRVAAYFAALDVPCELHYLDVDKETRWQRVRKRNRGDAHEFEVDRDMFEFCETLFQPLDEEERGRATMVDAVNKDFRL